MKTKKTAEYRLTAEEVVKKFGIDAVILKFGIGTKKKVPMKDIEIVIVTEEHEKDSRIVKGKQNHN